MQVSSSNPNVGVGSIKSAGMSRKEIMINMILQANKAGTVSQSRKGAYSPSP